MSEIEAVPTALNDNPVARNQTGELWAERTGVRQYVGRNPRGAEVQIGMGPGQFSPGELLKLALATCNTLSCDKALSRVLGEDFAATVGVSGDFNSADDRYEAFQVEMVTTDPGLSAEDTAKLVERVSKTINTHCTIGHTLAVGAPYERTLTFE